MLTKSSEMAVEVATLEEAVRALASRILELNQLQQSQLESTIKLIQQCSKQQSRETTAHT